jgi:Tfp pilus assembly protein PilF
MDRGEWDAAIEEFTEALDRDPQLWVAYLYRAEAYLQVDDLEAALVDFEAVIQARPAAQYQAIAHTGRGRIYLFYGQPDQALAELDQAVLLDPSEPFAQFIRGLIYHEVGQSALAIKDLEAALSLGLQDERSASMARQVLEVLRGTAGGS